MYNENKNAIIHKSVCSNRLIKKQAFDKVFVYTKIEVILNKISN